MKMFAIALFAIASCSVVPTPSTLQEPPKSSELPPSKPAVARLVADVRTVQAESTFRVGVLIEMEPGWHIYWKNPGEAGLPTSIQINTPAGFEVGEIAWPTPKQFVQPGDIVGYGYEGQALFTAEIRAPKTLAPSSTVPITAEARWLCCERVCIPGKGSLSLDLTAGAQSKSGDVALFDTWSARVPVDLQAASEIATIRLDPPAIVPNQAEQMAIDIAWKHPVTDVAWFSVPGEALDVRNVAVESQSIRTRISFTVQKLEGVGTPPDSFESLVAFTDSRGDRRSLRVPVALGRGSRG